MSRMLSGDEVFLDYYYKAKVYNLHLQNKNARFINMDRIPHRIPIQEHNKEKIDSKVNQVKEITETTIRQLSQPVVIDEIREKVYRKFNPVVNRLNDCLINQFDLHDQNACVNAFIKKTDEEVIPFTIKTLRDY